MRKLKLQQDELRQQCERSRKQLDNYLIANKNKDAVQAELTEVRQRLNAQIEEYERVKQSYKQLKKDNEQLRNFVSSGDGANQSQNGYDLAVRCREL